VGGGRGFAADTFSTTLFLFVSNVLTASLRYAVCVFVSWLKLGRSQFAMKYLLPDGLCEVLFFRFYSSPFFHLTSYKMESSFYYERPAFFPLIGIIRSHCSLLLLSSGFPLSRPRKSHSSLTVTEDDTMRAPWYYVCARHPLFYHLSRIFFLPGCCSCAAVFARKQ